MKKYAIPMIILLLFLASVLASYRYGEKKGRDSVEITERTDTLVRRDTLVVEKPEVRYVTVDRHDTLTFVVHDTDTVAVPIPIVRKEYEGEDYKATITGYKPELESITVFPKTVTIHTTQTVSVPTPYKWSVSPFAGVDIARDNFAARAGVEWRMQVRGDLDVYASAGYEVRNTSLTASPFATGGVRWNILHR